MSGILLTTAIVGTILMLTGCGGVLTWCGAAAAALLLKPALTLVESIGYLQDRLNTWSDDLEALNDQTKQSLYAIGSGGLKGLGLGNSVESSSGCRKAPTTSSSVWCAKSWASSVRCSSSCCSYCS